MKPWRVGHAWTSAVQYGPLEGAITNLKGDMQHSQVFPRSNSAVLDIGADWVENWAEPSHGLSTTYSKEGGKSVEYIPGTDYYCPWNLSWIK